jgi:hypothetical protein
MELYSLETRDWKRDKEEEMRLKSVPLYHIARSRKILEDADKAQTPDIPETKRFRLHNRILRLLLIYSLLTYIPP